MKVFVTGASGFIGSAVTKELVDNGHEVIGLARSDKGAEIVKSMGGKPHRGTIDDFDDLKEVAQSSDAVIHLAFKHDVMMTDYQAACEADRKIIEVFANALEGTNKPLIITSGTLMLPRGKLGYEDHATDLTMPVSSARAANEAFTLEYANKGVRANSIRLSPTNHGDGDQGFINMLVGTAKQTGVSAYVGKGENVWPAVHRLDTAKLYRLVLEKGKAGSAYHAVAEQGVQIKTIAEAIGKQLGLPVESKPTEHFGFLAFALEADNPTSSEKTKSELGWTPVERSLIADIEAGVYTKN